MPHIVSIVSRVTADHLAEPYRKEFVYTFGDSAAWDEALRWFARHEDGVTAWLNMPPSPERSTIMEHYNFYLIAPVRDLHNAISCAGHTYQHTIDQVGDEYERISFSAADVAIVAQAQSVYRQNVTHAKNVLYESIAQAHRVHQKACRRVLWNLADQITASWQEQGGITHV